MLFFKKKIKFLFFKKKKRKFRINYRKLFIKNKFYQKLIRIKIFFKYNQKLVKLGFKFISIIKYLRLWTSWFNCAFSYFSILYLLRYSYRIYCRKNRKFHKLYNLQKYFFNYKNFKNKRRYLKPSFLKLNSFFFISINKFNNKIYNEFSSILPCFFFFKYFFKIYFIFNFFWWYTKFCFKNKFSKYISIDWFLKFIYITYFTGKQYILNDDREEPINSKICNYFFFCHVYLLVR